MKHQLQKTNKKTPDKGDPSDVIQLFPKYNLQVLCCRYWWLQKWEFQELSFPYWRIYHNQNEGASIIQKGKEIKLDPNTIIMIAPNTSYATRLFDHAIPDSGYSLIGGRITHKIIERELNNPSTIQHLFIHFNMGLPFDNISPGIFRFELTDHLLEKITIIRQHLLHKHQSFSFYSSLAIQSLISDLLTSLPEASWNLNSNDFRIQNILAFIEKNLNANLANPILAEQVNMAVNSFTRLFTEEMNLSPQQYVQNKRVDQVCILLHHSNKSIEEIATATGFYDRFHLTKVFKKWTGTSPAKYKKEFSME